MPMPYQLNFDWTTLFLAISTIGNLILAVYLIRSRKTNLDAQTSGIHLSNLKGEGDLATQFRELIGRNSVLEKEKDTVQKLYDVELEGRKRAEGRLFEVAKTMGGLEKSEVLAREQLEEMKKKERGILTEIKQLLVKNDGNG